MSDQDKLAETEATDYDPYPEFLEAMDPVRCFSPKKLRTDRDRYFTLKEVLECSKMFKRPDYKELFKKAGVPHVKKLEYSGEGVVLAYLENNDVLSFNWDFAMISRLPLGEFLCCLYRWTQENSL